MNCACTRCRVTYDRYQVHFRFRVVFTSDGVIVGVIIRSVEGYDLVKIKPTELESEAEH